MNSDEKPASPILEPAADLSQTVPEGWQAPRKPFGLGWVKLNRHLGATPVIKPMPVPDGSWMQALGAIFTIVGIICSLAGTAIYFFPWVFLGFISFIISQIQYLRADAIEIERRRRAQTII